MKKTFLFSLMIILTLFFSFESDSFSAVAFTDRGLAIGQDSLKEAELHLQTAIQAAEASLGPHQPGSGWTKQHMQSVINILEGKLGADFKVNDAAPKEGENGVIPLLLKSQVSLKESNSSPQFNQAMDGALFFAQQAVEQAKSSVAAKSIDETHHFARLAAGMLMAAMGQANRESPVTGNLEYLLRHPK